MIAQLVKTLPTMLETWVLFLGWEDLLEKEMATHSGTLVWKIPWTDKPGRVAKSRRRLSNFTFVFTESSQDVSSGDLGDFFFTYQPYKLYSLFLL